MKYRIVFCLIWFICSAALKCPAQNKPDNVCYINNGRIYFQLDKRWSDAKKKEISTQYNLDSLLIAKAFEGKTSFIIDSITWQVTDVSVDMVELSKPVPKSDSYNPGDVMLLNDSWMINPMIPPPPPPPIVIFGVNKFEKEPMVKYKEGRAIFYLPGYQKASKVYLSGTFNNWGTSGLSMIKTGTGWEISIELSPGKYLYKYIVDGRWIHDPHNLLKERDGEAGFNSVLYCPNHVFKLPGYTDSKRVYVSGSFNNWKSNGLRMFPETEGWSLPVYLNEATYGYKFIVDGKWIPDPANSNTHTDGKGNINSYFGIGDTIVFKLNGYRNALTVILSGSFNDWNPGELVMNRTASGWELPYVLGAGNYEYKFNVDGNWIPDPDNPVTSGQGDYINSVLMVKVNYTFFLTQFADAKKVIVTGSFNEWDENSYKMFRKDGVWQYPVHLNPGKYTYKFIVDGKWMIDPANELWEENQYGTGNSVLWIDP